MKQLLLKFDSCFKFYSIYLSSRQFLMTKLMKNSSKNNKYCNVLSNAIYNTVFLYLNTKAENILKLIYRVRVKH